MLIRYVGPFPAVAIAATGQVAERHKDVEVDDTVAEALCRQRVWERASPPDHDPDPIAPDGDPVDPEEA